jgi:hypothetical protein
MMIVEFIKRWFGGRGEAPFRHEMPQYGPDSGYIPGAGIPDDEAYGTQLVEYSTYPTENPFRVEAARAEIRDDEACPPTDFDTCQRLIEAIPAADVYEKEIFDPHVAGFGENWEKTSLGGRIWDIMADGEPYTLAELSWMTGAIETSCSARVRDLRKRQYGGHTVNRQYVGKGLYTYKLVIND